MRAEQLIVRDYEQRRKEYIKQRQAIISSTGGSMMDAGRSRGQWASRTIEAKAAKLESLEHLQWVREMHAVEHARDRIGAGMPEEMRETLKSAIVLNCISGRAYPFERLFTVGISRRTFYRLRQRFLDDVAAELSRYQ